MVLKNIHTLYIDHEESGLYIETFTGPVLKCVLLLNTYCNDSI